MHAKFSRRFSSFPAVICAGMLLLASSAPVLARPSAMKLFPEETLLLVRTPNAGDLFDRLRETATGRMVRDPQLAPFVERLYGGAGDLYTEKVAEWLGVSWEELKDLPRAEVAFAIVARRDHKPAFVLLVDQGDEPSVAKRLLDSALERIKEDGGETTTETIEGVEVTVVREGDNQDHTVGIFEKEHTIVAATDPGLLREILQHWNASGDGELASASGDAADAKATESTDAASTDEEPAADEPLQYSGRTLAENNEFVTILRHCRRAARSAAEHHLLRRPDRADPAVQPRQRGNERGDGDVSGAGHRRTGGHRRDDDLQPPAATTASRTCTCCLDNPRAGVMQVIAFEPGDTTPEPWVFADLETYFTWNWNVRTSFNAIRSLVDRFQYEGATDKFVAEQSVRSMGHRLRERRDRQFCRAV